MEESGEEGAARQHDEADNPTFTKGVNAIEDATAENRTIQPIRSDDIAVHHSPQRQEAEPTVSEHAEANAAGVEELLRNNPTATNQKGSKMGDKLVEHKCNGH